MLMADIPFNFQKFEIRIMLPRYFQKRLQADMSFPHYKEGFQYDHGEVN